MTAPGQPREPRGRREGDQGVGGRFTAARAEDPPLRGATSHTQRRGLLRDDPGMFSDLLLAAADAGGLARPLVERDYWMCQIATYLVMDSRRHPGSFTSMGGGSFLALAGITQRVSEDVDLTVTHSRGILSCSSNHAKQMMEECQANVETHLGIPGERRNPDGTKPRGGGNYFRTVAQSGRSCAARHPSLSICAGRSGRLRARTGAHTRDSTPAGGTPLDRKMVFELG